MNLFENYRIIAQRNWSRASISLFFMQRFPGTDRVGVVTKIEMQEMNLEEANVTEPESININYTGAQELMDGLWECGIRPTEGTGSAGSLKATENHLHDLQKMSDRLLTLVEKHKNE